ncbi:MAG: LacI family transcriptional regulator [Spirochaetes bacterium]|nr:LacI family transcriptional regulator [Spirochaetota bacterium]
MNKGKAMVTQSEVAKKAGVSFITVSRVVNNKGNVKEKTKKRVLKVIKELGYYPNSLGRGLNMNRTFTIGIIVPFTAHIFDTSYYIELLSGIETACAEQNYHILLYPKKEEKEEIDYQRLFFERKADGLLIIAPEVDDEQIRSINDNSIPCVVVDGRQSYKNIIFIDSDNVKGAYLATEYLIKMGHKRIAFLGGWTFVRNGMDRRNGYLKALEKYSISRNDRYIMKGDFTEHSGYANMITLLFLEERPTAVFAANDSMAIGAMSAIKENGLKIPDDISIIGFDDIKMLHYLSPSLSTVKQFSYDMGYTAAGFLIQKINKRQVQSMIFKVELKIRESVKGI